MTAKFKSTMLALLTLLQAAATLATAQTGWVNSLKPSGATAPQLVLAVDGKPQYAILLPALPTSQEQKATEDLAHWLKAICGGQFAIVREGTQPADASKFVSIGNTALVKSAQLEAVELGSEGYRIDVRDETLFLRGGVTRGIINAVYALLEEDFGCRWYAVGADVIPQMPTLTLAAVPRTHRPVLADRRDVYYTEALDPEWSLRNRTLGININVPQAYGGYPKPSATTSFVHSFNNRVPREEFFANHPEYFMLDGDGKRSSLQLCLTNPEVLRLTIERIRSGLDADRDARIVDVSPNDGGGICQCEKCRAINEREDSGSGSLLNFVNSVAAALEDRYPKIQVSTLAYLDTISPPKHLRPRNNVLIWLCVDSHAWQHLLLFVWETEKFDRSLKAWSAIGAKFVIWDYPIDYHNYIQPLPNMPVVTENLRYYLRHGVTGIFLQAQHNPTNGVDRSLMRSWVWAKQMWDPSRDTQALIRDFNYGFYGKAAAPLQEYDDLLWQTWEQLHRDVPKLKELAKQYGPGVGGAFLTTEFIDRSFTLMQSAERLAAGDEQLAARVRLAKLPILYLLCERGPQAGQEPQQYSKLVEEFQSIAQTNRVTNIKSVIEGPNCQEIIAGWRKRIQNK